jgi:hypothetical protein
MPKRIADKGLEALMDAAHYYLCSLPPPGLADGKTIGLALGTHYLGQPEMPPDNSKGYFTGSILELLHKAGKVDYIRIPNDEKRYYKALNCPVNLGDLFEKWDLTIP